MVSKLPYLCQQPFFLCNTLSFSRRLKEFPVTIDYINRFKTGKRLTETLNKVEKGKVDILVGTHALVGKRVKFKDLGLLIIDEEQKFGVGSKG